MLRMAAILSAFSLVACETNDGAGRCVAVPEGSVTGTVTAQVVSAGESGRVVRVSGSVHHALGTAIRSVSVEGRPATPSSEAFNFSGWAVELPLSFVAGLTASASGTVTLSAAAIDACGSSWNFGSASLSRPSLGDVRSLSVELEAPLGEGYLPTTRAEPATVRVIANGEADGAEATVTVSEGTLSAGLDAAGSTNRVALAVGSDGTARGLLQLSVSTPGTLVVTVRAGDRVATGTLLAAGAPSFTPTTATLQAGTTLDVIARTPGRLASCTVETGGGVTVEHDGTPRSGTFDPGSVAGESVAFAVTVPADDALPFSLQIRCEDAFGQAATFTAAD